MPDLIRRRVLKRFNALLRQRGRKAALLAIRQEFGVSRRTIYRWEKVPPLNPPADFQYTPPS